MTTSFNHTLNWVRVPKAESLNHCLSVSNANPPIPAKSTIGSSICSLKLKQPQESIKLYVNYTDTC